ncbi:MAG: apolipoprotein N-acyltransferase [Parvibaculaceae bacterium]|nr:apolipoprotein N-acyltransferase [Parvibaculaceae bacterium]
MWSGPVYRLGSLTGWRRRLVTVLAGIVSALAMPPVGLAPLLVVTIPVLVWHLDNIEATDRRALFRRAFATVWLFSFGFFFAGLYWIGEAFLVDAEKFALLMPFAVTLLPAGLALIPALIVGLGRLYWPPGYGRVIVLAVCWCLAEWLRGHILTGFPWNLIGHAFMVSPALMQMAAITGAYGLSLVAMLVAGAFALKGARAPLIATGVVVLLFAGGVWRLSGATSETVPDLRIRIVQPDIPQTAKWDPEARTRILRKYLSLSRAPGDDAPGGLTAQTILVWPESALPYLLAREPRLLDILGDMLPPGALLVTGGIRADGKLSESDGLFEHYYNSIYVIGHEGGEPSILAVYDKFHLVPFGEYLPVRHLLSRIGLHKLSELQGSFDEGPGPKTLHIGGVPPVSPLICYEIIFPGAVTDAADRPQWMVNVTNDAWFGHSAGPYQHLAQVRLRAVEEGLPVIRAANTGVSAIVDGYGRVLDSRGLDRTGVIDGRLPKALAMTPYARFGDLIYFLMLLAAAAVAPFASRYPGPAKRDAAV